MICRYADFDARQLHLPGWLMTRRDRIALVFDEQYSKNGQAVHAATRQLVRQMQGFAEYRLFCKERYHGPHLGSHVKLVDRPSLISRIKRRLRRALVRAKLAESDDRWITNIQPSD